MDTVAIKPAVMTFYSDPMDIESHRCRIVLAEKGVGVDVVDTDQDEVQEKLWSLNPYGHGPTLMDRDLVIYQANIIMEYLDERYPHPPLLPGYPVAKSQSRLMIHRIERDWYSLYAILQQQPKDKQAKKELQEGLVSLAPIFEGRKYFLDEDFSLVDCTLAPLLWRLPHLGIELPKAQVQGLIQYALRVFNRPAFKASLSKAERQMERWVE